MARLGQIIKKLNIGIATAVDFLNKKGHPVDQNINLKLTPEQVSLLINEFSDDQSLKQESERLSQQRQEKEKSQSVAIEGFDKEKESQSNHDKEILEEAKPHLKTLGKIDLEHLTDSAPEIELPDEKKEEIDVEAPSEEVAVEEKQVVADEKIEEPIVAEVPVVPDENTKVSESVIEQKVDEPEPVEEESKEPDMLHNDMSVEVKKETNVNANAEVITVHSGDKTTRINVLDKIDLDKIDSSTRPPKKSKEEKKKERLAKERQQQEEKRRLHPSSNNKTAKNGGDSKDENHNEKKKRKRINGGERIDVRSAYGNNKDSNNTTNNNKKNNRKRKIHPTAVSEEDVAKQVKETLARLTEGNKLNKKGAKYRKEKREANVQKMQNQQAQEQQESKIIKLTEFVTVNELAAMMNVPVTQIIQTCFNLGMFVSINQRLDAETINIVADEFGYKTEFVSADVAHAIEEEKDDPNDLVSRPPIITVMGHVDHGKTSLLDYIRKTNVIAGEAGGITQHIGAYNVTLEDGRQITFLDTPGHEAFTAMRARGAQVTDIAIIIVAADDGVMPQTIEAINHASSAGVPIVFAINKVDKPGANPDRIKEQLANMNYMVEEWGGKYQSQDISAKKGIGVKELLEKVLLEAELLDLKANPNRNAVGSIIESSLDKGRGYVATVLVSNGTLHMGDVILAGTAYGRIKAMFNERNQRIEVAGPSEPATILGLNGAPQAGDKFNIFDDEHEAREIATRREQLAREQGLRTSRHLTLDEIGRRIALGNFQEVNVIVKGDVDGSIEALSDSLIKLSTPEIQVNVIHKAVGQISESDVMLAAASNAIIIGFQVRPSVAARKLAESEQIDIRLYSIIYDAIEELKAAMEGMLSPEIKEEIVGSLEVKETFKISKVGTIAGCLVTEGKIKRTNKVRLIRDGIVVYTGELASLKRVKDDVKEVNMGTECGLNIANFNDIKVGDIVEAFEEIEVKKTL